MTTHEMIPPGRKTDPTTEASQAGEFESGSRGDLSGRNWEQSRAIGQDDPVAEGSRQGRERYKGQIDGAQDESDKAV
jgi:hypothetical protein